MPGVKYFQHVLIGQVENQPIVNTLWYYCPTAIDDPYAAVEAFASQWSSLYKEAWTDPLPSAYQFLRTETSVYNASWQSLLSAPHVMAQLAMGTMIANLMGQSPYVVIDFILDYTYGETAPGHPPVRRSYLAYGPINDAAVANDHTFQPNIFAPGLLSGLLDVMFNEFTIGVPEMTFTPIRVGAPRFIGGLPDPDGYRSWAKVVNANFRSVTSNRRSRTPRPI